MLCQWCENPKDLSEDTYDSYCLVCSRYSREGPETTMAKDNPYTTQQGSWNPLGYLNHHACVWKYVDHDTIFSLFCINPVRANMSPKWNGRKCTNSSMISKEDFLKDQEKSKLSARLHSYEFLEEAQTYWKSIKPEKRLMTQEEIRNHPKYEDFLKFKGITKD